MAIILLTAEAQQQASALSEPIRSRIYKIVARLTDWPNVSGAKPLRGELAGRYRIGTGDYRVQFYIVGDVVTVEKIGHRDGFYGE